MVSIKPKLIIYIPTFNRCEKLQKALFIVSREIKGLEDKVLVYVSNNGSTDGTTEYLKSLKYDWLYVKNNERNIGFPLNVLHCFDLPVESEFIWIVGDDDYLMPGAISGLLSLIGENSDVDYIFCNTTAFPESSYDEVMRNYIEKGTIGPGNIKGKRVGTYKVNFEQLIDPFIADTLLGELMVHCFRQSKVRFINDNLEEVWVNYSGIDWDRIDFDTAGKFFQVHNIPFLRSFSRNTPALYCDVPRTFNFWGSADWVSKSYDYVFPIAILYLITQYKKMGFISDDKYLYLLDYYYTIMLPSVLRQLYPPADERLRFNSNIKLKMFEILVDYVSKKMPVFSKWTRIDAENISQVEPNAISDLTSIIILTRNNLRYTKECLKSIEKHTLEPYELIIVDNGSTDGTVKFLKKYATERKNVTIIENKVNLGFAAGNNQGMALAKGKYILLLNNDTIVTKGWLRRMISVFENYPDVGIVGPVSNCVSGPQQITDVHYSTIDEMEKFAEMWALKYGGQSMEFLRVVGFCMLIRREVIEKIGGLDERFGSGNFEDDDFCIRAAIVGYKARIALDVFIHHAGSQTFKSEGIDYTQALERNWRLFKAKWNLPPELPYGAAYNIHVDKSTLSEYYIPLLPGVNFKGGSSAHKNFIPRIANLVSIIFHFSGDTELAEKCLKSIREYTSEQSEVILVTHKVQMDAERWIKGLFQNGEISRYIIVEGSCNFPKEINEGIRLSRGEYIVVIGDDVLVAPKWLTELLSSFKQINNAGVFVSTVKDLDDLKSESPVRGYKDDREYGRNVKSSARTQPRVIPLRKKVTYCLLFKYELLEKVGLFDDGDRFISIDAFCSRVAAEGYGNYLSCDSTVYLQRALKKDEECSKECSLIEGVRDWQSFGHGELRKEENDVKEIIGSLHRAAVVLNRIGKPEESIKLFEMILNVESTHAEAHNDLGVLYFQRGETTKALHHLKCATELDGSNYDYKNNLAAVYLHVGRVDAAIECYQEVLEQNPDNVEANLALARLCNVAGLNEAAVYYYGNVLRNDPDNAEALKFLAEKNRNINVTYCD